MAEHPAKALGPRAMEIMDRIAIGQNFGHPKGWIAKLMKRGLVIETGERIICQDRFGTVRAMSYAVPTPAHMAWCDYWAEQPEAEGLTE